MNQLTTANSNLQYLVTVNYQRMMAFEQAAFNSNHAHLREAYTERADESESYLKELCAALQIDEHTAMNTNLCNDTFKNINAKKTAGSLLHFIASFEKTVAGWYKKTIADISSLPADIAAIINRQYKAIDASAHALQTL